MTRQQRGFSLLEVMLVMAIFLIVSGAVFLLLNTAQFRYRAEQAFLESFQGARQGMDQILLDVHNAGFPPPYTFAGNMGTPPTPAGYPAGIWRDPAAAGATVQNRFAIGIVGMTGSPRVLNTTCTVNGATATNVACAVPNQWELVIESDIDPENNNGVEWIYYDLRRPAGAAVSTLFRTVKAKNIGGGSSPVTNPSGVPFVEEILQVPTTGLLLLVNNPAVFTYECDPAMVDPDFPGRCLAEHVKNIYVTLRVQSTLPDMQTGQFRQITLRGAASREYPSRPLD